MTKTWRQARSIFYWTKWKTVVDILCCIYLRKLSWFHQHRLSFIILITSLAIRWYKVYHIKWDIAKLHTCPQRCCRLNTSSCKLTLFSAMLQVCNIFWSQRTSQVWIIPTDNFLVNFLKLSHENGQLWNFDPYSLKSEHSSSVNMRTCIEFCDLISPSDWLCIVGVLWEQEVELPSISIYAQQILCNHSRCEVAMAKSNS